jgi:hypothetical protein
LTILCWQVPVSVDDFHQVVLALEVNMLTKRPAELREIDIKEERKPMSEI